MWSPLRRSRVARCRNVGWGAASGVKGFSSFIQAAHSPGSELSEQADAGQDREGAADVVTWWVLRVGSL